MKEIFTGLALIFLTGCVGGITLSPSERGETEEEVTDIGGLPGHPTTSTLSTAALCNPGVVTSESGNLIGVLCVDPSAIQGVSTSGNLSAGNPLLEVGIEKVHERIGM